MTLMIADAVGRDSCVVAAGVSLPGMRPRLRLPRCSFVRLDDTAEHEEEAPVPRLRALSAPGQF